MRSRAWERRFSGFNVYNSDSAESFQCAVTSEDSPYRKENMWSAHQRPLTTSGWWHWVTTKENRPQRGRWFQKDTGKNFWFHFLLWPMLHLHTLWKICVPCFQCKISMLPQLRWNILHAYLCGTRSSRRFKLEEQSFMYIFFFLVCFEWKNLRSIS